MHIKGSKPSWASWGRSIQRGSARIVRVNRARRSIKRAGLWRKRHLGK